MPRLDDLMRTLFDAPSLERGRAYAENDHVVEVSLRNGRLRAVVEGHDTYEVSVTLTGLHLGKDHIAVDKLTSDCSCPKGMTCKHAVAALIVWAEAEGLELNLEAPVAPTVAATSDAANAKPSLRLLSKPWVADREQQTWLTGLTNRISSRATTTASPLIYALTRATNGMLSVSLVASRTLKNGSRGVAKRYSSLHSFLTSTSAQISTADRALVAALNGESRDLAGWGWNDVILSGSMLERVIATGRATWDDVGGPPLRLLPTRHVTAQWREQSDGGRMRLEAVDDRGETMEILPLTPPWFRDGDGVGPLTSELDDSLLKHLAEMPWLAPELVVAAAAALPKSLPPPPISLPRLAPQPWLQVYRAQRLDYWDPNYGNRHLKADVALIGFTYGEDEVSERGEPLMERADGSPLIRDLLAEKVRLGEAERLGLVSWPPPKLHTQMDARSPLAGLPLRTVAGLAGKTTPTTTEIPAAALAALAGSGWQIRGVEAIDVTVYDLTGVEARLDESTDGGWFELHLGIDVGGERLDLVPLLTPLLRGGKTVWENLPRALGDPPAVLTTCGKNRLVRVPLELLADLHAKLVELFDHPPGPGGGWRIDAMRADLLDALDRLSPRWLGDRRLRDLAQQMRSCLEPPPITAPADLQAELRPYQLHGLAWLQRLRVLGVGGILADDMGLGKTVQAIAHLVVEHQRSETTRASLVVCPASMVGVWRSELTRFAPTLPVTVLHGAGRERVSGNELGVLITSYATLTRDIEAFAAAKWQVVIADEAQAFKNVGTAVNAAMRRLDAHQRLCLTGTPVENHLGELHALLGWAAPGVLGQAAVFSRAFRMPIEDTGDRGRADLLRRRIAPFLLRRTKAAVASDLPPRTDIDLPVELGPDQRRLYEAIRLTMDDRVREAINDRGLARSGLTVLEALLRLRQVCCDPRLLPGKLAKSVKESAKLDALRDLLTTLVEEKRQVLVFSQFTSLLDLVTEHVLVPAGIPALRLDGATRHRSDLVERFQSGEAPVFLLSLKAGGTGLTLTAADTVILLDPWWNPAVERQASDRAHRIGQDKPVTIYRLVANGTIESRIRALQSSKAALADALLDETGQALGKLSLSDIEALMKPVDADV